MATCIALEGVSFKQTHKAVGRLQCVCVCEALRLANTLAGLVHDGRSVIIYVYTQTHIKSLSILHLAVQDNSVYRYSVPSNIPHACRDCAFPAAHR